MHIDPAVMGTRFANYTGAPLTIWQSLGVNLEFIIFLLNIIGTPLICISFFIVLIRQRINGSEANSNYFKQMFKWSSIFYFFTLFLLFALPNLNPKSAFRGMGGLFIIVSIPWVGGIYLISSIVFLIVSKVLQSKKLT
jgi:hypothetical protein